MHTAPAPLKVARGAGAELELSDGTKLLDCISSWWVTLHGHSRPEIAQAIAAQARTLEQVIFAGFTHEPAEMIANRVVQHLPEGLSHVFFSDNGSTAVEVSLKMAMQYWQNQGESRRQRFIGFQNGYHGDTVGAMSMGGTAPFWQAYRPAMFDIDAVEFPATFDGDASCADKEERALTQLQNLLTGEKQNQYAAVCIEPLVQGAAGMRVCRPQFLQELERLARTYDVLVIYDEVMTGFGRTGDFFASLKSGTTPDIIAVSKGITGGFLPLALTVTTRRVYESFLSDDFQKAFFHSHSYTANPIACAAAVASMQILENEKERFTQMEDRHRSLAEIHWRPSPRLTQLRFCGTIAACDVIADRPGYFNEIGPHLRQEFLKMGLLLRPLGNTIYVLPPYCIDDQQLERAYRGIALAVASL